MYKGKQVRLFPFERQYAEKYRRWVNDEELLLLVDRVLPVTEEDHLHWYEAVVTDPRIVIFAIETLSKREFLGCTWLYGIDYRHRHAEVRILIGNKGYWGKGLGDDALSVLSRFAFEKLNLHKLFAYVLANNSRALRAFENVGYKREGILRQERYVNGSYVDLIRVGLLRSG